MKTSCLFPNEGSRQLALCSVQGRQVGRFDGGSAFGADHHHQAGLTVGGFQHHGGLAGDMAQAGHLDAVDHQGEKLLSECHHGETS